MRRPDRRTRPVTRCSQLPGISCLIEVVRGSWRCGDCANSDGAELLPAEVRATLQALCETNFLVMDSRSTKEIDHGLWNLQVES